MDFIPWENDIGDEGPRWLFKALDLEGYRSGSHNLVLGLRQRPSAGRG